MKKLAKFPDEIKEQVLQMKSEEKTYAEISEETKITVSQVRNLLDYHYRKLRKENPEKYPARSRGRQPKPEKTRKELEKEIKELKKEIKLYKDFLHLAGRM